MFFGMGEKKNLTEREVEATYGIRSRHLRLMRARNTGPRYLKISGGLGKRGGRILYPVAELEGWLGRCPTGGGENQPAA